MGIKKLIKKGGEKAGEAVAKLAALTPGQLQEIEDRRNVYLSQIPSLSDENAEELTNRLLGASSIEIFNAYLPRLHDIYAPVESAVEYGREYATSHNVRYIKITKWVTDKAENSIEKLLNVYQVLSNEDCNIGLVFHRKKNSTEIYIAVANTNNDDSNVSINNFIQRIKDSIRGNFPGAEWDNNNDTGTIPPLKKEKPYSIAITSNAPTEKSEKFISQTIEKLLDGIVPDSLKKEYILILLATPIQDIEERKLQLAEFYSALVPYSSWSTDFTYTESGSENSSATFGVNAGVSAGVQQGINRSKTNSQAETDSSNQTVSTSDSETNTESQGSSHSSTQSNSSTNTQSSSATEGKSSSQTAGGSLGYMGTGVNYSNTGGTSSSTTTGTSSSSSTGVAETVAEQVGSSIAKTVGKSIADSLGKAITKGQAVTKGISSAANLGANFGANFARSSNVTITVGKNEGIHQSFVNYNIKHALEILEEQTKRLEEGSALGMWDFAAYVLSEDPNTANNVAHTYLALTQGIESNKTKTAVNLWRGDLGERSKSANTIFEYLKDFRHPIFGLNPGIVSLQEDYLLYPSITTATTALSGKELAYALNFPKHAVAGLPILECAEFGRNVVTYEELSEDDPKIDIGNIFHMNHSEGTKVELSLESLKSHVFITGSTGSGKSNTVYDIVNEARKQNVHFLIIEPAKGEYKNIFGNQENVNVYGTNPSLTPLLRINPFSFPDNTHVLEHLDRLVEIFNVCWPMYAAMPAVLKSAIEKSYVDCGWDLLNSINKYGEKIYPQFIDVAANIKEIVDSSEYDSENKGAYKGALLTRLQSLTTGINGVIFSSNELSNNDLFDKDTIIDLSRVGSTETKSLIMGILVLKLQEYRMSQNISMNSNIRHITVLEEAHNLLKRTSIDQPSESSNILGKSVEMITNAIAEMRTYGEGFFIVDQSPGLLDMAVIRNTNTKIIMRLPDQGDRELVGKSAGLNDDQIKELSKLPKGVAAIYQNEWVQPILCKVDKYDGTIESYQIDGSQNEMVINNNVNLSNSLLKNIMDKELLQIGDKTDLKELKDLILRANINSTVKIDFLDYLSSEKEEGVMQLGKLIYDFLDAERAIDNAKQYSDIREWVDAVIEKLNPSVKGYTKKQIDLTILLILQEQMIRDFSYKQILNSYYEIYKKGGGVF